jgi:hypothetical protein
MKKHTVWVCAALALSIALIVVACTVTQTHGPGVYIYGPYVQIYPGTKISSDDQKALDAILKNFNQSLYKIRAYDRGKLVKTQGTLEDTRIDQVLLAEISKASQKGVSVSAEQIGAINPHTHLYTRVITGPTPYNPNTDVYTKTTQMSKKEYLDCKRLVSRVGPILQKYSPQLARQYERAGN